jgi:hypothetical protein
MKNEHDFIQELESRAAAERRVVETEMLPLWARGIGEWLVVNPWRVLVPSAGLMYLVLRILLGGSFRELVLRLFGGY